MKKFKINENIGLTVEESGSIIYSLDKLHILFIFLDSSMVEHTAVNRGVVGSSPTRGVFLFRKKKYI